jgi:mono/diheme cytochrome c family protein
MYFPKINNHTFKSLFSILFFGFLLHVSLVSFAQEYESPVDSDDPNDIPEVVEEAVAPATQVPDEVPSDAASVARGRDLFGQHCTVCHLVEKQLIGPALASVHNTRPIPWLIKFIKNSQYVIRETDDAYAQHLFKEFNGQIMPAFEFLSDDDILNILAYIKAESVSPTYTGGVNGIDTDIADRPQEEYNNNRADVENYDYGEDSDLNNNYSFNQDETEVESGTQFFAKISLPLLILFAVVTLAVVVSMIYVFRASRKLKEKQNA